MTDLSSSDYKILLIEDNPGDIVLIRDYLSGINPNLKVKIAKTFERARDFLTIQSAEFDVILLDLKLPDKEGEDLIKEIIRLSRGNVPVIVLTGYSDMKFSIKSLSLGIADYIIKDELNPHLLWKSIRFGIERFHASEKIQESERRYRYLFENNPSSIIIWDLATRLVVDTNQQAEKKYGYSKERFKKIKIDEIQPNGSFEYFLNKESDNPETSDPALGNNVFNHKTRSGDSFAAEVRGHFIEYEGNDSVLMLINDVTDKIDMQERLFESTLRAEEEERNRIAKELHDGIVQQLVACGMFIQTISDKVENDKSLSEELSRLYELLTKATIQTRDISHNLKSAEFESKTLPDLLNQFMKQLNHASLIEFQINNHLDFDKDYNNLLKINIYRSVQELCNNIIKHSGAKKVVMTAEEVDDTLFISIKDDGKGFTLNKPEYHGIGIKNVESRIQRLGGEIEFREPENGGLQVDIEVPLQSKQ